MYNRNSAEVDMNSRRRMEEVDTALGVGEELARLKRDTPSSMAAAAAAATTWTVHSVKREKKSP